MTAFLYVLAAVLILVIVLGLIAPKTYKVNRKISINKPINEVFEYLKFLKNQNAWSPWMRKDPNMKKNFSGTDGTSGFLSKWEGNKEVGSGEQEITRIVDNEIIESKLRFFKPYKSESDAYISVKASGEDVTEVNWGFSGNNKFPMSIMMLFMNMDKMVGKEFEEGLSSLKSIMEESK